MRINTTSYSIINYASVRTRDVSMTQFYFIRPDEYDTGQYGRIIKLLCVYSTLRFSWR